MSLLLAALGREESDDDDEIVRVHVGAKLMLDGLGELTAIRKILQQVFKKDD